MHTFFEKRDHWGHGLALWVLAGLFFLSPVIWLGLQQLNLQNEVENWLPADDPQAQVLRWFYRHFEHDDSFLVSWDGGTLNDPRITALARLLEQDTPGYEPKRFTPLERAALDHIAEVITPLDVIQLMANNGVDRATAIQRLEGVLVGTGLLKARLTPAGKQHADEVAAALVELVQERTGLENVSTVEPVREEFPQLPEALAEYEPELEGFDEETPPEAGDVTEDPFPPLPEYDFELHWPGIRPGSERVQEARELAKSLTIPGTDQPAVEELFFASGSPVALSVSLTEEGSESPYDVLDAVRAAAVEVGIPPDELHMGGSPVARSRLNLGVKAAGWNSEYPVYMFHKRSPVLLSIIVGTILAYVMLRSFRLATLVLITALYTTLATLALVPPTGGSMNMVLVVMPNLLMTLTMSGAIHMANYWRHVAVDGSGGSIVRAYRMARQPCALASLTTAIGLASLSTSVLVPVRDFGIYSAIGCVISLVLVLYGLPSMMFLWRGKPPKPEAIKNAFWKQMGRWLAVYHTPVTIVCLIAFGLGCYGLRWFHTETKVIRYFPEHTRIIHDYNFLEENLAGIVPVEVVIAFNQEALQESTILERMELVRDVQQQIREHPDISGSTSLADFRPATNPPPPGATTFAKLRYRKAAQRFREAVFGEKADVAGSFISQVGDPLAVEESDGIVQLDEGDEMWRIRAQVAIMSDLDYDVLTQQLRAMTGELLADQPGAHRFVTGMVPLFLRTQQAVLQSLIESFGLAFAVIGLVIIVLLRNPIAGSLTMLPNLWPVGVVFGMISWGGMAVDIGTMITASVALGIAVDGTLHLITWFRDGLRKGMTRQESIAIGLGHCGPALWQTSAAVAIGLLMLSGADLLLVSRFGWLMAVIIAAALFADLVFLPALLAGPLGSLIERTMRRGDPTALDRDEPEPLAATSTSTASRSLPSPREP